jgi:uncharacterized protein
MKTDPSPASATQVHCGSVTGLWRYPVKSMMGEELNAAEVTRYGLLGDRKFAVVDPVTGKVAGAKNPRKWGNFFEFRAAYAEPPHAGAKMPAVRLTLPDGTTVTSDQPGLTQVLSKALGREATLAEAPGEGAAPAATAEEYWPDMEGLDYRDTVTDWELPPGTFFDLAIVHLLTTATIDRLRALYPPGRFEGPAVPAEHSRGHRRGCAGLRGKRLDRARGGHRRRGPPADHGALPALRHDHAGTGRPAEGLRHPADRGAA